MEEHWAKQNEVAGKFWLKITYFFVTKTPNWFLRFVVFIVVSFYFILLVNKRKNIKEFRKNVRNACSDINKGSSYSNFYNFAIAICDKIAIRTGKESFEIDYNNLEDIRRVLGYQNGRKGKILLTTHYGNIEVAKALVSKLRRTKINVLMYEKNNVQFNKLMGSFDSNNIKIFFVDELDIKSMLYLRDLLEKGEHIAIMADRIPIGSNKIVGVDFLGNKAYFSIGAYLMAGMLDAKICTFWCYRLNNKYVFDVVNIPSVVLTRDKVSSIMPSLMAYISDLENKCKQDPNQWYNFFDFWRQYEEAV